MRRPRCPTVVREFKREEATKEGREMDRDIERKEVQGFRSGCSFESVQSAPACA